MKTKIKNKLCSTVGETIGETLVSLLIIMLALAMLAGSIVSAAKVNKSTKDMDVAFTATNVTKTVEEVKIKHNSTEDVVNVEVSKTNDKNGYLFYE